MKDERRLLGRKQQAVDGGPRMGMWSGRNVKEHGEAATFRIAHLFWVVKALF